MRRAFINALADQAAADPKVVLLTADLGFSVVEPFVERFADRFFNVGVAEQNMIGVATGLAEAGFQPYCYSIAPFAVLRAFEFIRNGPVLHHLPVRVVGVGGGVEYGTNNLTHYGLDDVGVTRTLPGLRVLAPADAGQAAAATRACGGIDGPVYLRLGKDDESLVPGLEGRFRLGHCELIGRGGDVLLAAMGPVAGHAVEASRLLRARGVRAAVAVVSTLSPTPDDLASILTRYRYVVSVESHFETGGLGSMLSEVIAENGLATRLSRCGFRAIPNTVSGSQAYMERTGGLGPDQIAWAAVEAKRQAS
jgi:transketolase